MDYRACWGIGDRYVIQYSGNLGIGHDVSTICQAILALKNDDGIRWVFVGDGVRRPELRLFVEAHGIRNVIFKPYEPRSRLGLLLSLADVHLVSMSSAFEGVILPSKFFGAMAAGRPTIFVGPRNSEVAHVITEQGCGFVVDNDDAEALGEAIRRLRRDPGESLAMGARGRAALSSTYAVQHSCERWWHVVRSVSETRVVTSTTAGQFEAAKIYPENHLDAAPHRLKILIISQYFAPDITAAAYRITDTYRLLRQTGHEVRVITSTPHKGGVDNDALLALGANDLLRVEVRPLGSRSVGAYLSQFFGFVWRAFFQAIRVRRTFDYDVVWASSPPLLLALCTVPLRLVVRRPVVLDIRDVWPESAVSIGKLRRGSAMERIGLLLERAAYRFSDGLTCVSEPMARYLRERTKVPVTVVYNGTPRSQLASCDRRSSNPDRNVFCYAGNLGYAQGLHGVLRAFERFTSYGSGLAKCRLRLIGTGALEGELRTLASALGIADQVEFLGVRPKAEALSIMASSGTLLIPLVDSAAFELTVPSKVFDCMAIGRPIIASIAGEGREILASTGANIVVAPDDVEALSKAFVQMHSHWDEFMAHGHMNVQIVRDKFSREGAVASLECALRAVVSTRETK
jgi:glycosyltransferase involved in cell wall biosynthesis